MSVMNKIKTTLEKSDLDYMVRCRRTGHVVAAFLNSRDAHKYVEFLSAREGCHGGDYEIETTNPGDFNHKQVIAA